jgi:hypothetical protein
MLNIIGFWKWIRKWGLRDRFIILEIFRESGIRFKRFREKKRGGRIIRERKIEKFRNDIK